MAAIGDGWATDAWVEVGWTTGAWARVILEFLQPLQATPQGIPAGAVDDPQLYFRLTPTIVPDPVLDFLQPFRGLEFIEAGAVDDPQLHFRLEPTIVPDPVLDFLQPLRGLESVKAGAVKKPQLLFRLEPSDEVSTINIHPWIRRRRR